MNKLETGNKYESLAASYLEAKGYKIINRNYRTRVGEIDIIALKDHYICFVEVKYRKNNNTGNPEEAVSIPKMKKICKVSQFFLYGNAQYQKYQIRYDVIAIEDTKLRHIENAFDYIS